MRNWAVPSGALLILLTQTSDIDADATGVRIIATVFGFLIVVLALSGLNVILFNNAATGTWRQRLPSIFVDLFRIVLIGAGLAVLFSWVWGANVGGLFAALSVTSIVLGLALQNSVGSIIAGLLLLFEQPFELGDWLDAGGVRGGWSRSTGGAVHIDTGNGTQIVPNASLAGAAFTNLSRPTGSHTVAVDTKFAPQDAPDAVLSLLDRVAAGLTELHPGSPPTSALVGPGAFRTSLSLQSPADTDRVVATFPRWTWYASRRADLHLDGAADGFTSPELAAAELRRVAGTMHVRDDEIDTVAAGLRVERYGAGEVIVREGVVPEALLVITSGQVDITVPFEEGEVPFGQLGTGEYTAVPAVTRETALATSRARNEVTVLRVPRETLDDLIRTHPTFARELGDVIDRRSGRRGVAEAQSTLQPLGR